CQELAHNYGRMHVNCGRPEGIDSGYPYATDTLSSPEANYIGFNPFSHRLILPTEATDFMSYCPNNWVSDYTWKGLFNLIGNLPAGATLHASPASLTRTTASSSSLILGIFDREESRAAMKPALPLLGANELTAAQQLIAGDKPNDTLELP